MSSDVSATRSVATGPCDQHTYQGITYDLGGHDLGQGADRVCGLSANPEKRVPADTVDGLHERHAYILLQGAWQQRWVVLRNDGCIGTEDEVDMHLPLAVTAAMRLMLDNRPTAACALASCALASGDVCSPAFAAAAASPVTSCG
jgi:hypothetical protein